MKHKYVNTFSKKKLFTVDYSKISFEDKNHLFCRTSKLWEFFFWKKYYVLIHRKQNRYCIKNDLREKNVLIKVLCGEGKTYEYLRYFRYKILSFKGIFSNVYHSRIYKVKHYITCRTKEWQENSLECARCERGHATGRWIIKKYIYSAFSVLIFWFFIYTSNLNVCLSFYPFLSYLKSNCIVIHF